MQVPDSDSARPPGGCHVTHVISWTLPMFAMENPPAFGAGSPLQVDSWSLSCRDGGKMSGSEQIVYILYINIYIDVSTWVNR
jgi:hypothetical protein